VESASGASIPTSFSVRDRLSLGGPFLGAGVGVRVPVLDVLELSGHLLAGAAYLRATDELDAVATADGRTIDAALEGSGSTVGGLDFAVVPTLELGLVLGAVSVRLGFSAAFFMLAGPEYQHGDLVVASSGCDRIRAPQAIDCAPGNGRLAHERAWGPFAVWAPAAGIGYSF
jgi:hypothetical protein